MAENFSSYISSYLKAHPEASLSSVKDALGGLREDLYHAGSGINSIWPDSLAEGESLSSDDFMTLMSNATQKDIDELDAETMDLFFDIVDKDDDGKLSQDELDIFKNNIK